MLSLCLRHPDGPRCPANRALSLQEAPTLDEGWITDFSIKMWGIYPTLIPYDGGRVSGMVARVETEEHFQRLAEYETSAYTWCPCRIYSQDGRVENRARTFIWSGDPASRELVEGEFDLARYQKYFKRSVVRP